MSSSYDYGRSGWTARPPDVFLRLVRKQRRRVWGERPGIPAISFLCDVEAGSSTMIYRRGVERGYQCERDRVVTVTSIIGGGIYRGNGRLEKREKVESAELTV